jgi:hypothetical protein
MMSLILAQPTCATYALAIRENRELWHTRSAAGVGPVAKQVSRFEAPGRIETGFVQENGDASQRERNGTP